MNQTFSATKEPQECEHEWRTFKETIRPDYTPRDLPGGHTAQYLGSHKVYFKVRACIKCKKKKYLDYLKESY